MRRVRPPREHLSSERADLTASPQYSLAGAQAHLQLMDRMNAAVSGQKGAVKPRGNTARAPWPRIRRLLLQRWDANDVLFLNGQFLQEKSQICV